MYCTIAAYDYIYSMHIILCTFANIAVVPGSLLKKHLGESQEMVGGIFVEKSCFYCRHMVPIRLQTEITCTRDSFCHSVEMCQRGAGSEIDTHCGVFVGP